jgi:hypothetical protein
MKPEIYGPEPDMLDFLNETEKAFLHCGSEEIKKVISNRGKMFIAIHRAFYDFVPKKNEVNRLTREEWKKKATRILNLQFKLTNEQAKTILDQYWQKVTIPKGGLAK